MAGRRWCLVLALLSLGFAPAPLPKPERPSQDSTDMRGVWRHGNGSPRG